MGLCKCPKRKVTNLFCFEHRVNVCEHCLVANHNKCIVKSYLQWLQDSDYSAACTLCNRGLAEEDCGDCVRLSCYCVFHWGCLNQYASQFPAQTAPAGYSCPTCSTCIFPQTNLVSPVADALRAHLKQVNWARAGLGLPLLEESEEAVPPPPQSAPHQSPPQANGHPPNQARDASLGYVSGLGASPAPSQSNNMVGSRPSTQASQYNATAPSQSGYSGTSVISVDEGTTSRGQDRSALFTNPRKLFDTTKGDDEVFHGHGHSHDHDDDKYKRRPALQWLARWFQSIDGSKKKDPNAVRKRFAIILMLGIIGFITIIIIFSKLGRRATEDDPFFDPLANPNIKVADNPV